MSNRILIFFTCLACTCNKPASENRQVSQPSTTGNNSAKTGYDRPAQSKPAIKGLSATPDIERSAPPGSPWYSGGNLHKAKLSDWVRATYANRLATSGDFIATRWKMQNRRFRNTEEVKVYATQLEKSITEVCEVGVADQPVSEVAVFCTIAQGW